MRFGNMRRLLAVLLAASFCAPLAGGGSAVAAELRVAPAGSQDLAWTISAPSAADTDIPVTITMVGSGPATGTITFIDTLNGFVAHQWTVDAIPDTSSSGATLTTTLEAGTHWFSAQYSGDDTFAGAYRLAGNYTAAQATASATGVGVGHASFYPVLDHYRDTLAISGTPLEPVTVAIHVDGPDGTPVASFGRADLANSPWSFSWSGRTTGGAILPAGTYTVVQTLRDGGGAERTWTSLVKLSRQSLVWHRAEVVRRADRTSARHRTGAARIRASAKYGHGLSIRGGAGSDVARLTYDFDLRKAVVYGTAVFSARGTAVAGHGSARLAFVGLEIAMGRRANAWYGVSSAGHPLVFVSGRRVRAAVIVRGANAGRYDVAQVRLRYRWASLSAVAP